MILPIEPSKDEVNLKGIIRGLCNTKIRHPMSYEDVKAWLKQFSDGPESTLALLILRFLIFRTSEQLQSSLTQALKKTALHFMPKDLDPTETYWKNILDGTAGNLSFHFGPPVHQNTTPGKSGEVMTRQLKQILPAARLAYANKDIDVMESDEIFLLIDDGIFTGNQMDDCITDGNNVSKFFDRHPKQVGIAVGFAHEAGLNELNKKYPNIPIFYGEKIDATNCFESLSQKWIDDQIWPFENISPLEQYMEIFTNKAKFTGIHPLGWNNLGCLIAYEHGIPDDSLTLLHKQSTSWSPLFIR